MLAAIHWIQKGSTWQSCESYLWKSTEGVTWQVNIKWFFYYCLYFFGPPLVHSYSLAESRNSYLDWTLWGLETEKLVTKHTALKWCRAIKICRWNTYCIIIIIFYLNMTEVWLGYVLFRFNAAIIDRILLFVTDYCLIFVFSWLLK